MEQQQPPRAYHPQPPPSMYQSLVSSIHIYTPVADADTNPNINQLGSDINDAPVPPVRVSRSSGEYFLERCDLVRGKNGGVVSLNNVYEERCREEFSGRRIRGRRTSSAERHEDVEKEASRNIFEYIQEERRRPDEEDIDALVMRESETSHYSDNNSNGNSNRRSYTQNAYAERIPSSSLHGNDNDSGMRKKLSKNIRDAARKLVARPKKSKHRVSEDEYAYGYS